MCKNFVYDVSWILFSQICFFEQILRGNINWNNSNFNSCAIDLFKVSLGYRGFLILQGLTLRSCECLIKCFLKLFTFREKSYIHLFVWLFDHLFLRVTSFLSIFSGFSCRTSLAWGSSVPCFQQLFRCCSWFSIKFLFSSFISSYSWSLYTFCCWGYLGCNYCSLVSTIFWHWCILTTHSENFPVKMTSVKKLFFALTNESKTWSFAYSEKDLLYFFLSFQVKLDFT